MDPSADRWAVIVSDTDSRSAAVLNDHLNQLGYEVVEISDPEGIRASVRIHPRVFVLATLSDRQADAARLCREWRENAKQCCIMLLLERYRGEDVAAAFEGGADEVLVKPIVIAELRARLRRAAQILTLEDYRARLNSDATLLEELAVRCRLHSRRYLQAQLSHEIERARRFTHALALILAEVAHANSDERRLRSFGVLLNNLVRAHVDWVARYTDRTFALVLPETTLLGALSVAHRVRGALTEAALVSAGLPAHLKISFGITALDQVSTMDLPDKQTLMDSAEACLREAIRAEPDHIVAGRPSKGH